MNANDAYAELIRRSKDAGEAREALMGRAWPAKDLGPLILLIADPRTNFLGKIERQSDNFGKELDDSLSNYSKGYVLIYA